MMTKIGQHVAEKPQPCRRDAPPKTYPRNASMLTLTASYPTPAFAERQADLATASYLRHMAAMECSYLAHHDSKPDVHL